MRVLVWGASSVTLGIWTTFQDPFNPIKLALIIITAAWLLGHLLANFKILIKNRINQSLIIFVSIQQSCESFFPTIKYVRLRKNVNQV